jgi:hypothetical protein
MATGSFGASEERSHCAAPMEGGGAANPRSTLQAIADPSTSRDSSTWVRRNGCWLCALHTEAIAGDPFGRDRQRSSKIQG